MDRIGKLFPTTAWHAYLSRFDSFASLASFHPILALASLAYGHRLARIIPATSLTNVLSLRKRSGDRVYGESPVCLCGGLHAETLSFRPYALHSMPSMHKMMRHLTQSTVPNQTLFALKPRASLRSTS